MEGFGEESAVYRSATVEYRAVPTSGQIGSGVPIVDSPQEIVPREAGTGSVEDWEVEGVGRQDGSSLVSAVEHLCRRRTWKSPGFRASSKLDRR